MAGIFKYIVCCAEAGWAVIGIVLSVALFRSLLSDREQSCYSDDLMALAIYCAVSAAVAFLLGVLL